MKIKVKKTEGKKMLMSGKFDSTSGLVKALGEYKNHKKMTGYTSVMHGHLNRTEKDAPQWKGKK